MSAGRPTEDAELMLQLRAGQADAFDVFFGRYVRLVYRVARGILKDKGEAEDVTQEIFLEVYRKACLYDSTRGSVRTWLLQYAYHRAVRRKTSLQHRAAYRGEPIDVANAAAPDHRPRLTRDECRWVLRAGLARLPYQQRATIELTCFEDLTLKDVAERLGVSIGCTRHYYYRGLARLQAWARLAAGQAAATRSPARARRRRSIKPAAHASSAVDRVDAERCRDRSLPARP